MVFLTPRPAFDTSIAKALCGANPQQNDTDLSRPLAFNNPDVWNPGVRYVDFTVTRPERRPSLHERPRRLQKPPQRWHMSDQVNISTVSGYRERWMVERPPRFLKRRSHPNDLRT